VTAPVSLPATRQTKAFTSLRAALDSLTFHVGNADELHTQADALARLREHRRAVSDLEREVEQRIADDMTQDIVNLGDDVVLERRRGTKRTKWQSQAVLAQLGIQARVDADGVVQPPDGQFTRLYEAVQDCCPLTASLPWRAGALRERGIDPDEYAATEPGRVSVKVSVKGEL